MKLQTQPNCWSCLPTSIAMLYNRPVSRVIEVCGHDGSEIVWDFLPDPQRRRAFHMQEMIDFAFHIEHTLVPFEMQPTSTPKPALLPRLFPMKKDRWLFLESMLARFQGILIGCGSSGQRHAVAWDQKLVYDPNGTIYEIGGFDIQTFWADFQIKSG